MVKLLQLITQRIEAVHNRVYRETASQKAQFPYIVYLLPNSTDVEGREDFILQVDVWYRCSENTLNLEILTDSVDKVLNRLKHVEAGFQVSIYRLNRLDLPDPDPEIHRRQLRYQVKAYFV